MISAKRVLVVEDESTVRSLMALVLREEGYAVDGAADGREAFTTAQRVRPDVLVIDLDLPVMDGSQLVRACRADEGVRHIPIIVVSGMYDRQVMHGLDVQAFMTKPYSLDSLLDVLKTILC